MAPLLLLIWGIKSINGVIHETTARNYVQESAGQKN